MKDLQVGQVLSLKIRFNNNGDVAATKHPYLIVGINDALNIVEIAQLDSLKGKEYKAILKSNKTIYCDEPSETVIDQDSYVQLDNSMKLEYFEKLSKFRRQTDKLSPDKLKDILDSYKAYHETHEIDDIKNVYMDEKEITTLNP